jgi:hypothetical protein
MRLNYFKTIILSIILVVFSCGLLSAGDSPIGKGAKLAGGSFAYTSRGGDFWENGNNDKLTIVEGRPVFMFFVAEGLAMGVTGVSQKRSQGEQERNVFGIGPEIQYYFDLKKEKNEFKGKFLPFVALGAGFVTTSNSSGIAGGETIESSGFTIRMRGGIGYMLSNSIATTIGFSYSFDRLKQTEPEKGSYRDGNSIVFEYGFTAFIF